VEAVEMTLIANEVLRFQDCDANRNNPGCVSYQLLFELEWYLSKYFAGKEIRSVETGCGGATLLFSFYSSNHTVYVPDDTQSENSRVCFVKNCEKFDDRKLTWVFGDTLQTLVARPPIGDIDIVLINGTHSYPVPDFEMFCISRHLVKNGIIVIESTQIPTIQNLYSFLMQDDDYRFQSQKSGAAVFQRVKKTERNSGDEQWWNQGYNARNYVNINENRIDGGIVLPIKLVFGDLQKNLNYPLCRGFSRHKSKWVAEGQHSRIQIRTSGKISGSLKITLDVSPIGMKERQEKFDNPGYKAVVNSTEIEPIVFSSSGRIVQEVFIQELKGNIIDIEFWHIDVCWAGELSEFKKQNFHDVRVPNFYLNAITVDHVNRPKKAVNVLERIEGSIFSFDYDGKNFSFLVDEPADSVENFHANGQFYEIHELEIIRTAVKPHSRILEVGSHVGNHTVFFSAFLSPKKIVVIEPNQRTQKILRKNLRLNDVREVDLKYVDYAFGASRSLGSTASNDDFSSGSAHVEKSADGEVEIISGDELFVAEGFDFIKIDVEGMEIEVLRGLKMSIMRSKAIIFIEVQDQNVIEFSSVLREFGYSITWQNNMYPGISNFLISPSQH
jgi:FkbM family methyltransferase